MTIIQHEATTITQPNIIALYEHEKIPDGEWLIPEELAHAAFRDIRFRWQLPDDERVSLSARELLTLNDPIGFVESLTADSEDGNVDIVGYYRAKMQFEYHKSTFNHCDGESCNHEDKGFKYWDYDCAGVYEPSVLFPLARTALVVSPAFSSLNEQGSTIGMRITDGSIKLSNGRGVAQLFIEGQDTPIHEMTDVVTAINTFDNTISLSIDSTADLYE
jgi:hypothetical protein